MPGLFWSDVAAVAEEGVNKVGRGVGVRGYGNALPLVEATGNRVNQRLGGIQFGHCVV